MNIKLLLTRITVALAALVTSPTLIQPSTAQTQTTVPSLVTPSSDLTNPVQNGTTPSTSSSPPSTAPSSKSNPQIIHRVPLVRRSSGVPVIGVGFNGNLQKNYEFLLDTAASVSVITPQIASEVGWFQTGSVEASLSNGERITIPIGTVPSIQIGGAKFEKFTVAVGPVPLIGQNFLQQFTILISPTTLLLRPNSTTPAAVPLSPQETESSTLLQIAPTSP